MTTPRLTPSMRALLECAGCLAPDKPIPRAILTTATDAAHNAQIPLALQQLIGSGFLRQVDEEQVRLTAKGHRFLAERSRSPRTRDAVELALLITARQLLAAQDSARLAALVDHMAVAIEAALPRADDKAAMLAATFLLALLELRQVETIRRYLPRLQTLEEESGYAFLPDGLVAQFASQPDAARLSQPMTVLLQLLAALDDRHPAPLALLHAAFGPPEAVASAVADLVAQRYVTQPDANSLLLTAAGRQAPPPIDPETREALRSGLITAVVTAADQKDQAALRQLRPHVQTITDTALPAADEAAYQLLLTLIQCLLALGELPQAAYYVDMAEELEAALGLDGPVTRAEGEGALQYHAQVAVHYFQRGDFERARRHFEQAISLTTDPALLPLLNQKVGNCCGQLGDEVGKIQAYLTALDRALAHHGRDSWELGRHRNELALVFLEYGHLDTAARHLAEALHQAQRAPADHPHSLTETAKSHLLAARIAYQQGRMEQADAQVAQALALTGRLEARGISRASLLYMAASLRAEFGDRGEARRLIDAAYAGCPTDPDPADVDTIGVIRLITDLRQQLAQTG
ncbi:MAG: hypothetical protein R6X34_23195 [Chloroflexota bacterium]